MFEMQMQKKFAFYIIFIRVFNGSFARISIYVRITRISIYVRITRISIYVRIISSREYFKQIQELINTGVD